MAFINLLTSNPTISIVTISFLITLVMTLVTKYFTDQTRMKELKDIQKKHQAEIKKLERGSEKQKRMQKEMLEYSMELIKHSFKPVFITFIPIVLIFLWIRGIYLETAIANTWFWWYIGSAIASSIVLRKVLNVA